MTLAIVAVVAGLIALVWSADRFVAGAASTAHHAGMPPLLIGMVVVGFGTSAPELTVSVLSAVEGKPAIALGNAYGSNIGNIALILGVTALISPIAVLSQVLRRELPLLALVTGLAWYQLRDGALDRGDAIGLLIVFAALLGWTIYQGLGAPRDPLGVEVADEMEGQVMPWRRAITWLVLGLCLLVVSSRVMVWGAVEIARALGVGELLIGLTVVAIGTSLPELASSIVAARHGKHDLALGNVIGSNLFNTLLVVGVAGAISPIAAPPELLARDLPVMAGLTLALFAVGVGVGGPGRINRVEGGLLVASYVGYTVWLIRGPLG